MALPLLALPVIHSAGGWIASAGGSYIAGTLSSTWAGAFIAGNSGILTSLGLGAAGIGAAAYSGAAGAVTSIGTSLGIITPTFLGLTPVGWGIAAGAIAATTGAALYFSKKREALLGDYMDAINEERIKGGVEPFESVADLIKELKGEIND
jgi:hypothetical protein